jgi:putative phosphoribosyl transferase
MGAIGEEGVRIVNENVVRMEHITQREFVGVEQRERAELIRRANRYRPDRPRVPLTGRTAIVVDDGIATGSTARAACQVARAHGAARVILAVPVAPPATLGALADAADDVVCLEAPDPFFAIGQWYRDFSQTADAEVVDLLRRADTGGAGGAGADVATGAERDVVIPTGPVTLTGRLTVPPAARGLVVFAHGSGSGRRSPRNMFVAGAFHVVGLGTLLFDLLTPEEEADRSNVFDIGLLASRLSAATGWLRAQPGLDRIGIGYFGASTGAAAALRAAAAPGQEIAAIVSRGGRPDLAGPALELVRAPTLLIVGGLDDRVLELNVEAQAHLPGETQLAVVPGASHLFAEPGSLEQVASLAREWFTEHLPADQPARRG